MVTKLQRMENDNKEEFWLKFRSNCYGRCKSRDRLSYFSESFFQIEVLACSYWKNEELEEGWRIENKEW